MNKYSAIVLEDTFSDQLAIEMVLNQFPEITTTFTNSSKSFLHEISKNKFDIFIVDIMLNESLTGIDLLHAISDIDSWVIISSSLESKDYYEEYKYLKFKKFFIKKPIDEFVFKTNLESFLFLKSDQNSTQESDDFVMIKQGNYINKVSYDEILYIETKDHASTVHTQKNKFTTYTSLKVFEETLRNKNFIKVNRNTLVNMKDLNRINFKENYIDLNGNQLPISRSSKQALLDKFDKNTI